MKISSAEFITSSTKLSQCPDQKLHEYAFIGRSNVGKSSLINKLVNQKSLAKTSSRPGKTRLINHFLINGNWYLVDLPGYGYARVSKTEREKFSKFISEYLLNRINLSCVFVLIDSRLEPQKTDLEFVNWLGFSAVPFVMVFTKTDKVSGVEVDKNIAGFIKIMKETWDEIPPFLKTSIVTGVGCDQILKLIEKTNKLDVHSGE